MKEQRTLPAVFFHELVAKFGATLVCHIVTFVFKTTGMPSNCVWPWPSMLGLSCQWSRGRKIYGCNMWKIWVSWFTVFPTNLKGSSRHPGNLIVRNDSEYLQPSFFFRNTIGEFWGTTGGSQRWFSELFLRLKGFNIQYLYSVLEMGVSKNNGKTPQIIYLFIGFSINYKPSILGGKIIESPYFWFNIRFFITDNQLPNLPIRSDWVSGQGALCTFDQRFCFPSCFQQGMAWHPKFGGDFLYPVLR